MECFREARAIKSMRAPFARRTPKSLTAVGKALPTPASAYAIAHQPHCRCGNPIAHRHSKRPLRSRQLPIPDRPLRRKKSRSASLVRSMLSLSSRGRAAHKKLGENMHKRTAVTNIVPATSLWVLTAFLVGLPAAPTTSSAAIGSPPPTVGQRALIEAHDTAGIGWWSSPAAEAPAPDTAKVDGGNDALPADGVRPRRTPSIETE
jgi:hypothetical protein